MRSVQWTTAAGSVPALPDRLWLHVLEYLPEANGYYKEILSYDPVVTVIKFGLVNRSCQLLVVGHGAFSSKARALLERKRERNRRAQRRGRDPRIVQLALDGDIDGVLAELERGASLESCGTWTEVEEKMFYDKSWTWHNDTPLSMACNQGHLALVQVLLQRRANPHHGTCNECDKHYTPLKIALQMGHLDCAKAVRDVCLAESETKAKTLRDAAVRIFHAAIDETSLREEQDSMVGSWQNRVGQFVLEPDRESHKFEHVIYREDTSGLFIQGTLKRRYDGWWQGELRTAEEVQGLMRIKVVVPPAGQERKLVHQIKEHSTEAVARDPVLSACREGWGDCLRSWKRRPGMSDEEAERSVRAKMAQRDAELEVRRDSLRRDRAQQRHLERKQFRQEMRSIRALNSDEFDDELDAESAESEFDSLFDEDECMDDLESEFDDRDDTDECEDGGDEVACYGGHAKLLYDAAKHMECGQGGGPDLEGSANLCAAALSLESERPAGECDPKYSAFGKAMQLLRDLKEKGVPEAAAALPRFARIDEEKAKERDARRLALEARQKAEAESRQQKKDECQRLRELEVQRCRPLLNRQLKTGVCTNTCHHNADFCTYQHSFSRDLPPHCLHFTRGRCLNGDRCWFNHLRCTCGTCRR